MSRTGFTINERLSASDHSHRNRLRLFRKLDDFKNSNSDTTITLEHDDLADILTSCGYSTSDFTAGNIKLSTITSVNQIPLKHHMTGSLIINQAHHQHSNKMIEIRMCDVNGNPDGSLVLNGTAPGKDKEVQLLTSNNLEQSGTNLTFGGNITFTEMLDASNSLIKAKDISASAIYVGGVDVMTKIGENANAITAEATTARAAELANANAITAEANTRTTAISAETTAR